MTTIHRAGQEGKTAREHAGSPSYTHRGFSPRTHVMLYYVPISAKLSGLVQNDVLGTCTRYSYFSMPCLFYRDTDSAITSQTRILYKRHPPEGRETSNPVLSRVPHATRFHYEYISKKTCTSSECVRVDETVRWLRREILSVISPTHQNCKK